MVTAIAIPNQASDLVGHNDGDTDQNSRNCRCFHRNREALDNVGPMAGLGRFRNRTNGAEFRRGVVLRHPNDQPCQNESDNAAPEQVCSGELRAAHLHFRVHAET